MIFCWKILSQNFILFLSSPPMGLREFYSANFHLFRKSLFYSFNYSDFSFLSEFYSFPLPCLYPKCSLEKDFFINNSFTDVSFLLLIILIFFECSFSQCTNFRYTVNFLLKISLVEIIFFLY